MNKFLFLALTIFYFVACKGKGKEGSADLIVIGSETQYLTSELNGKNYKLYVNLPSGYDDNSKKEYPVLYQLDGQWDFAGITSSYYGIRYDGFIPDIIIIGISYGGENPDFSALRGNDLTPSKVDFMPHAGGAELFLEVLEKEIIPLVDNRYRTEPGNRTLAGTSFGGLFTHYALFSRPEIFSGYIITNPSVWWDNEYAFRLEEKFSSDQNELSARVFYASGEMDGVNSMNKLVQNIRSRNYTNLELEYRILKDMGHSGSKAESQARGLNFIFKRSARKLTSAELKPYTGTYSISWGGTIDVVEREGELAITDMFGNPNIRFKGLPDGGFSYNGSYNSFEFTFDEDGNVSGFEFEIFQGEIIHGEKVN